MYKQHAVSQSSVLQEMVKVKKLRFKNTEDQRYFGRPSRDAIQRKANFEEFKQVYGDSLRNIQKPRKISESRICPVHKTKSGSLYRLPTVNKEPQYVETINIELPLHYGADRAVQVLENKIKPKKSAAKVHRQVETDNIVERLKRIEEVAEKEESTTEVTKKQVTEIQKQIKARNETIRKGLPRVAFTKAAVPKVRRKPTSDKILSTLHNINEKLQKMQEKYLSQPKIQYKSVNDCFIQTGHVEVIYENDNYPEELKAGSVAACDIRKVSGDSAIIEDTKMQQRIKEMNEIFPEFPKIEDTLKEIEAHLDNIVSLEVGSGNVKKDSCSSTTPVDSFQENLNSYWNENNLASILSTLDKRYSSEEFRNKQILRDVTHAKDEKLRSIRQQIEEVEDFYERMSELAHDKSDDMESLTSAGTDVDEKQEFNKYLDQLIDNPKKEQQMPMTKTTDTLAFMEGPDLRDSIKKSTYLSREFSDNDFKPMVKVFSDNDQMALWRRKMKEANQSDKTDFKNVESVERLMNNLRFTMENSIYEPVA